MKHVARILLFATLCAHSSWGQGTQATYTVTARGLPYNIGSPWIPYGTNVYPRNASASNYVSSPVTYSNSLWACTSATVVGSFIRYSYSNYVEFTVSNNTTFTWNWVNLGSGTNQQTNVAVYFSAGEPANIGTPYPPYGTNVAASGSIVTSTVSTPVDYAGHQWASTGATVQGGGLVGSSEGLAIFVVSNNTVFTWHWIDLGVTSNQQTNAGTVNLQIWGNPVQFDSPDPPYGSNQVPVGSVLTARIDRVATNAGHVWVVTNSTLSGGSKLLNDTNLVVLVVSNDAILVWNWFDQGPVTNGASNAYVWVTVVGEPAFIGPVQPPYGSTNFVAMGSIATSAVSTPTYFGSFDWDCTGATVQGGAVLQQSSDYVIFQVTNNTTVTWAWQARNYTGPVYALSVSGFPFEIGAARPYVYGTHALPSGVLVSNSIASPVWVSGTQYRCFGWTGYGSAPASGSDTTTTFNFDQDSGITWQWSPITNGATNATVQFTNIADPPGAGISVPYKFGTTNFPVGTYFTNSVSTTNQNYTFVGWTGTGDAPPSGTTYGIGFVLTQDSSLTWHWVNTASLTSGVLVSGQPQAVGSPNPPYGFTAIQPGSVVTAVVASSVSTTGVTWYCTGATASGAVTASSNTNLLSFVMPTGTVSLAWHWETRGPTLVSFTTYGSPSNIGYPWPYGYGQFDLPYGSIATSWHQVATFYPGNGSALACTGWTGTGSAPASGTNSFLSFVITQPSTVTWYWETRYDLRATSQPWQVGTPLPAGHYGSNYIAAGSTVTASVESVIPSSNGARYVCAGWTGSGSVPPTGSTNSVTFDLNEPSTISWLWEQQQHIDYAYEHGAIVGPPGDWWPTGQVLALKAVPDPGFLFNHWEIGGAPSGTTDEITVAVIGPVAVSAIFAPDPDALPGVNIVAPSELRDTPGQYGSDGGFEQGQHAQSVFSGIYFTNVTEALYLVGIQFRPDETLGAVNPSVFTNTAIVVGSYMGPINLPSLYFQTNLDACVSIATIHVGAITLSLTNVPLVNGTTLFNLDVPVHTPCLFQPGAGGLLFDVVESAGHFSGSHTLVDGAFGVTNYFTGKAIGTFPQRTRGSGYGVPVTRFRFSKLPMGFAVSGSPDPRGSPQPLGYGQHDVLMPCGVTNTVVSPVAGGKGVRYVCTGWNSSGGMTASGTDTQAVLPFLAAPTELTWFWKTQHRADVDTPEHGSIDGSPGWYDVGTSLSFTAAPAVGYAFGRWTTNGSAAGTDLVLRVTLDQPADVAASFAAKFSEVTPVVTFEVEPSGRSAKSSVVNLRICNSGALGKQLLGPFWFGFEPTSLLRLENPDGVTADGIPYSDITAAMSRLLAGTGDGDAALDPGECVGPIGVSFAGRVGSTLDGRLFAIWDDVNRSKPSNGGTGTTSAAQGPTRGDFDGDGIADAGVYQPRAGTWQILQSEKGMLRRQFGYGSLVPVAEDYDGDGRADMALYDKAKGTWYELQSDAGFVQLRFGRTGTVPVPADYDGDGKRDEGVYDLRSATWYLLKSRDGFASLQFGYAGCVPVTGDFDGDGIDDLGVYNAARGRWYLLQSKAGFRTTQYGYPATVPVVADFDGDGRADIGVYDMAKGLWFSMGSGGTAWQKQLGYVPARPVVGDFDGDGRDDYGVHDPLRQKIYLMMSARGFTSFKLGSRGGIPVNSASP